MLSFGNCDQIEQDIIVTNYVMARRVLTKQTQDSFFLLNAHIVADTAYCDHYGPDHYQPNDNNKQMNKIHTLGIKE